MSDVYFYHTDDGGEIDVIDGAVSLDGGLRSAVYLSLFGGPEDGGRWWGGLGLTGHLQALSKGMPLISGNLPRVRDAALLDLAWLKAESVANRVEVQPRIIGRNVLELIVRIGAYGEEHEFRFTEVWGATREAWERGRAREVVRPPYQGVPPYFSMYAVPFNSTDVLVIDPIQGTAVRADFGLDLSGGNKWVGIALGPDGKLYCAPLASTDVLVIDPVQGTAVRADFGLDLSGGNKWDGIAAGADGKLYCAPLASTDVLVIDPVQGTAVRTDFGLDLSGTGKWSGIALGPDGKLYCAPLASTDVLVIDPVQGTAVRTDFGLDLSGTGKWSGIALGPDGKLYCAPRSAVDVLVIDPVQGTAVRTDFGLDLSGLNKWEEVALGPDGKLYCAPRSAVDVLVIDPIQGTATLADFGLDLSGANKWSGIALGPDGKLYCAPRSAVDVLVIDPVQGTAVRTDFGLDLSGVNKWFGIAFAPTPPPPPPPEGEHINFEDVPLTEQNPNTSILLAGYKNLEWGSGSATDPTVGDNSSPYSIPGTWSPNHAGKFLVNNGASRHIFFRLPPESPLLFDLKTIRLGSGSGSGKTNFIRIRGITGSPGSTTIKGDTGYMDFSASNAEEFFTDLGPDFEGLTRVEIDPFGGMFWMDDIFIEYREPDA